MGRYFRGRICVRLNADSHPVFLAMIKYIVSCVLEALGYVDKAPHLAPPGEVRPEEDKHIHFIRTICEFLTIVELPIAELIGSGLTLC